MLQSKVSRKEIAMADCNAHIINKSVLNVIKFEVTQCFFILFIFFWFHDFFLIIRSRH